MRKLLFVLFGCGSMLGSLAASGQSFLTSSGGTDTVSDFPRDLSNSMNVENPVHSATASPVTIKWTIQAISLASGVSLGFCDNQLCRYGLSVGNTYISAPYTTPGLFHAVFNGMNSAPVGSVSYVTVLAEDTVAHFIRTLTFRAYKPALNISNTSARGSEVSLYPNPARNVLNVKYGKAADVKAIVICNLIGRTMKTFRPMVDDSAQLDLESLPPGIYFMRLVDSKGQIATTRRFIRE